jgi:4-alpha-glucanotransferase
MNPHDVLSSRLGIEPEFRDASGQTRRTSATAARLLSKAFGFPADTEDECLVSLKALEHEDWQPLPPVKVVAERDSQITIPVNVPAACTKLDWTLTLESGEVQNGSIGVAELAMSAADDARTRERRLLPISCPEIGYHRLSIEGEEFSPPAMSLIVVPERCYLPEHFSSGKPLWGISLQLYSLRSANNWGIGDFSDLKRFVRVAADLGAAVVGLNPLHAMFIDAPEDASPYSPASRLFLNVLYIDVTAVAELRNDKALQAKLRSEDFQRQLESCRASSHVAYTEVARLKLPVLEALHRTFEKKAAPHRHSAFDEYCLTDGAPLDLFCRFQALREHFRSIDSNKADWRNWPKEFRDPHTDAVEGFCRNHASRIRFFKWMQWIASEQLKEAATAAHSRGMAIGLYRDLAVGANPGGAETWSDREAVVANLHVGAPPDILNATGQDWGLPPFDPRLLRKKQYAAFIKLVRANMLHAGGLRIDHVMALQHLYLIPEGHPATEGAYVTYPLDDLVGIIALESERNRCVVVGEDLGTVPEGFRQRMERAAILSYRVVLFEVGHDGEFIQPDRYPTLSLSTLGSHDLATMKGWWSGRDIDLKVTLGLYPDETEIKRQREQRAREKTALIRCLAQRGEVLSEQDHATALSPRMLVALHRLLGQTRSGLAIAQLDDFVGEADQVNVPGTSHEYPNWRRKYSVPVEDIATDDRVRRLADALSESRSEQSRGPHGGQ